MPTDGATRVFVFCLYFPGGEWAGQLHSKQCYILMRPKIRGKHVCGSGGANLAYSGQRCSRLILNVKAHKAFKPVINYPVGQGALKAGIS